MIDIVVNPFRLFMKMLVVSGICVGNSNLHLNKNISVLRIVGEFVLLDLRFKSHIRNISSIFNFGLYFTTNTSLLSESSHRSLQYH